jgi:hypothetical protein
LPGDRIDGRPVCVTNHPGCLPIIHLLIEVLRRPVESALDSAVAVMDELVEVRSVALSGPDGLFEGVEREVGLERSG